MFDVNKMYAQNMQCRYMEMVASFYRHQWQLLAVAVIVLLITHLEYGWYDRPNVWQEVVREDHRQIYEHHDVSVTNVRHYVRATCSCHYVRHQKVELVNAKTTHDFTQTYKSTGESVAKTIKTTTRCTKQLTKEGSLEQKFSGDAGMSRLMTMKQPSAIVVSVSTISNRAFPVTTSRL